MFLCACLPLENLSRYIYTSIDRTRSEVSCRDAIRQARVTRVKSKGLQALRDVNLKHSENGAHRVFRTFGQSLPVKISKTDVESMKDFPYVRFSSWMKYLIEEDYMEHLVGVSDLAEMKKTLTLFWKRYQMSNPNHRMFHSDTGAACHPEVTIPILHHGDEGRSHKKKQIMILSLVGILGRGTSRCNRSTDEGSAMDESSPLHLSMLGDSLQNHFLFAALPIKLYNQTDSLYQVLSLMGDEMDALFNQGVLIGQQRYFVAMLGVKGDSPYLAKSGRFERTFCRRPTKHVSQSLCIGICHRCLAGREGWVVDLPYEEFGAEFPTWSITEALEKPYVVPSPLLRVPFLKEDADDGDLSFWQFDLFHNIHLGMGKNFISSAVCICIELLDGSLERAFQSLTLDFQQYCRSNHESPYHKKLSPSLFGVDSGFNQTPEAGWSKGDFTRLVLKWFEDYAKREVLGKTQDPICLACVALFNVEAFCCVFTFLFIQSRSCKCTIA